MLIQATLLATAGAMLTPILPARAQVYQGSTFNPWQNLTSNLMMTRLMLAPITNQAQQVMSREERAFETPTPEIAPNKDHFRIVPDLVRRRANLASFLKDYGRTDPAGAVSMQAAFATADPIVQMGEALKPF